MAFGLQRCPASVSNLRDTLLNSSERAVILVAQEEVVSKLVGIPGCREPETLDYTHSDRIRIRNLVGIRCLHILVN